MEARPTTPTGPVARPGNAMRVRATNQNYLAQNAGINAAEKQRRLNQAAKFREMANEMNAHAQQANSSSAHSLSAYEAKLRASIKAHGARTGFAKISEAELKKWEADYAKLVIKSKTSEKNVQQLGTKIRAELKKDRLMGGKTRRGTRRSTRRNRSTRRSNSRKN
jgi:hypothetical protein